MPSSMQPPALPTALLFTGTARHQFFLYLESSASGFRVTCLSVRSGSCSNHRRRIQPAGLGVRRCCHEQLLAKPKLKWICREEARVYALRERERNMARGWLAVV